MTFCLVNIYPVPAVSLHTIYVCVWLKPSENSRRKTRRAEEEGAGEEAFPGRREKEKEGRGEVEKEGGG